MTAAGRSFGSRLRRRLLLALAAIVAAALLCEVIVRVGLGEQPKFPRRVVEGPFGLRINEPGAAYRHQSADVSVRFRINSKGMRADRDIPYEKPAGVRRIVSLGDSFTVGYEVALADCFSSVLERELAARGHAVEVLNAGVSGYGTAEACLYLERELARYSPDLVLISFYGNDLVDNVRSDLFGLEEDRLVERNDRYVPLGPVGDFLNRSAVFNFLSERSDAFALLKESATRLLKGRIVRQNQDAIAAATPGATAAPTPAGRDAEYAAALTAALYERLYAYCRERGLPLVIQSIASNRGAPLELVELFPLARFDVARPGITFQSSKELLDPLLGKELLYWTRSTGHWTPLAHRVCGRALAERIDRAGLLPR